MATRRYYTRRDRVPLKPGQTLGYVKGKGYYAKGTPKPPVKKPVARKRPAAKRTSARPARKPAPAPKPHVTPKTAGGILIREKLVRAELAAAALHIHEVGANNHGPWVKRYLAHVGLPEGYAWCDAFQSFEESIVAGHRLPIESASVGQTYATAKTLGWVVKRPRRGDLVCFDFDGDGQYDDHIGIVVRVLRITPTLLVLKTVEGNTSSGTGGSQADGGGVYIRTRTIARNRCAFVRIPGKVAA